MLKHKSLRFFLVLLVTAGFSVVSLSGCSTPPKPKELNELERILQAPDALEVRDAPGAGKYYREAREYRRVSRKAYEKGDMDDAREYAILGTLRYRTAAAIKKQVEDAKRLEAANAQVASVNPKIKALSDERNKLAIEVGELEQAVAQAKNDKKLAQRRAQARQNRAGSRNSNVASAERLAARNRLDAAKQAQGEALRVKADEYAQTTFNRANNALQSAQMLFDADGGSPREIERNADQAAQLFRQAANEARPQYQEFLDQQKPPVRRAQLRDEATKIFGAPFVTSEPMGVRIILAMTFDKGSSQIRPASQAQVASAAKLAKEFSNAKLSIEGYTRKGDATENLAISSMRARHVRDAFVSAGVDQSRISTSGEGQAALRYPDDPANNDRVEVVFSIPD